MTNLLINSAKITSSSITAHTRNAMLLSRELEIELISTSEELKTLQRSDYDTFIIVGAAFYPKTAEIEAWIRSADVKKTIWINNEYQVSPNSEYASLIKDYPSLLYSRILLNQASTIEIGALCSGLVMFAQYPFIGGQHNKGHGKVDIDYCIDGKAFFSVTDFEHQTSDDFERCLAAYNTHLDNNKDAIIELLS